MNTKNNKKENNGLWQALGLAWQLGYMIAVPIVLLALIGRLLDKLWNTSPWMLLIGIFLSLITSTTLIYIRTMRIFTQLNRRQSKNKKLNSKF